MISLGIDYGLQKTGIAIAHGELASPYTVLRLAEQSLLIQKINQIIEKESVSRVVLGLSEGEMAEKTKQFAIQLQQKLSVPVLFFDETLTSQDAAIMARQAGIGKSRRQKMSDAFAAALMLQQFLDEHY